MMDSVNPNTVSLHSEDFTFLINPNVDKNYRYIEIVSTMLQFHAKVILSANQIHATGHFYENNPLKLGGKQRLVTTDGRESFIFISDGIAYLPVRFPTNEYMESYTKLPLTIAGEWNPQYIYDDGQWGDSDNDARFGANVSATSYNQSDNTPDFILSTP